MLTNTITIHDNILKLSLEQVEELSKNEYANFFQTKKALHFFESIGTETFSFAVESNHEITALVSGIIQKEKGIASTFTSRAIIYGGPILSKCIENEHVLELFNAVIQHLKSKVIYIEIRNFNDYSYFKDTLENIGFKYQDHLNFHVDCDTKENIKQRFSSSKLRQIKKSLKHGAITREANSESEIEEFYEILNELYKTKVKTPLPDLYFFITLWSQQLAKFFLVFYEDTVVGGIVCPIFKNKVIYEWYICGKDGKYKNIYPSVLATWSAIDFACEHNIERFDFMGAGKPDQDYGVREFKSKFGGNLVAHGRFIYIANPLLYNLGKQAVKALKKL